MSRQFSKQKGSALAMGAALAFVLIVIGAGAVFIMMLMGGSNEVKNAVDSGALSVGKEVQNDTNAATSVQLANTDEQQFFKDVTSGDGKVTLANINRVWAKALLVAVNADAAGDKIGSGGTSVQKAYNGATEISDALTQKLTTATNLQPFFQKFASANSVHMLGAGSSVQISNSKNWQTSLMDRGRESNIQVPDNLVSSFKGFSPPYNWFSESTTVPCTRNPKPEGAPNLFLPGYVPLSVSSSPGNAFWQVPFQWDVKPHLVSGNDFNANTQPPKNLPAPGWTKPVPNAFSVEGKVMKSEGAGQLAMSWVKSNPRQTFLMCMPHSFVHIKLDELKAHWYFFPPIPSCPSVAGQSGDIDEDDISDQEKAIKTMEDAQKFVDSLGFEFGSPTTYSYGSGDNDLGGMTMPLGGVLCASVTSGEVSVGADVYGRTLDQIIFGAPPLPPYPAGNLHHDAKVIEATLVNRINQMITKPGVKVGADDLHSLLNAPETIAMILAQDSAGQPQDFYIFSPDGENLKVLPKPAAIAEASWLAAPADGGKPMIEQDPDGASPPRKLVDAAECPAPVFFTPDVVPAPYCAEVWSQGWGTWDKDLYWQSGSGYNGCLGMLEVKRWTNLYSLGICVY